jgi:hypothetical protein
MSRIGTGEGAQAYGHGLYFAGNEGVAKGYREALAPGAQVTLNGFPLASADDPLKRVAMWIRNTGAHPDEIVRISEQRAAKAAVDAQQLGLDGRAFADEHAAIAEAARNLSRGGKWEIGTAPNGHMYEVNLNTTPDRLLDWDAPLSGQSPQVRAAIESVSPSTMRYMETIPGKAGDNGGFILSDIAEQIAGNRKAGAVEAASRLREAGIPGIQYLDAGSRAAGDGSRNYVMFDDKLIDILRRYGVAGTLGGGAAATSGTNE